MPMTWQPSRMARRVTPRMAGLRPGTSPPPVRMPMTPRLVLILAITLGSPSRCVVNMKLSPEERNLGRVKQVMCLSPIILSPLNGQVKMSPHEQGDILIESERVATSGGDFSMYQGRGGVCQSRRAALLER